jgi:uncharacterized membrane protein
MEARKALAMWVERGLLSSELSQELAATLEEEDRGVRSRAIVSLFVSVGALLAGGGLFLFIASHWDSESPLRRMLLLVAVYFLVVAAAIVADGQRLRVVAHGLWFLSAVTVGVNVFLIGQIFNLPLNYWQGTLLWLIAVLAVGRLAPSFALGWLAVVLSLLTIGWFSVPESQFFDQGAFLWDAAGIRPLMGLVGLTLVAGASLIDATEATYLAGPARAAGVVLIAGPLVVSTFHPAAFAAVFEIDFRVFHVVVVAATIAVVAAAWARARGELLAVGLGVLLVLHVSFLPQVGRRPDAPDPLDEFDSLPWLAEAFGNSELLFLVYGFSMLGLALATVVAGRHYQVRGLVNTGLFAIGVLVMAAYIGRVAGALPTSVAFLIGGALLVAVAVVIERKRRDLTARAGVES